MSILKKRALPFTQITNNLLNDTNISLKAKGLYAYMFSKPEGWNFTIRSMAKQLKEGEDALKSALKELKKEGWVEYRRYSSGRGEYTLNLSASPATSPNVENPYVENPQREKPPRISNKDSASNKEPKKYDETKQPPIELSEDEALARDEMFSKLHLLVLNIFHNLSLDNASYVTTYEDIRELISDSSSWSMSPADIERIADLEETLKLHPLNYIGKLVDTMANNIALMNIGVKPKRFGNCFVGVRAFKLKQVV